MESIPDRLNPVVKPLMESIKRERCQIIQQLAAQYLVKSLDFVRNRNPNPINKIVINLCHLLKSDLEFTPRIVRLHFFCISYITLESILNEIFLFQMFALDGYGENDHRF